MDKTLVKGMRVLECVARSGAPRGASDVAAELGMTKSNAYRTLQTLVALKYLTRLPGQPVYEPTAKLFELGTTVANRFAVKPYAPRVLREVVRMTGENAAVAILDDREIVYVECVDSPDPVRTVLRVGERLPAYCSAAGKVLLAYAPDELIGAMEDMLLPFTENTVTTLARLRAELAEIREAGVATVLGEWHKQVAEIAVPIRNTDDVVVAALAVSAPASRFDAAKFEACREATLWGAEEIQSRI